MQLRASVALYCLVFCAFSASADGDVILSTLGPGDSYIDGPEYGYEIYYFPQNDRTNNLAVKFTPSADYRLTSIELALEMGSGVLPIYVATNNTETWNWHPTGEPGTTLDTLLVDLTVADGLVTLTSARRPILRAGRSYWIYTRAGTGFPAHTFWRMNDQGITAGFTGRMLGHGYESGGILVWDSYGEGSLLPALRINGALTNIVPEPASVISVIVGAACLGLVGLRRRARD